MIGPKKFLSWWPFCLIDPRSLQNLKPFVGHNFGTAQDIDMIQTPISFFFQALSDGLLVKLCCFENIMCHIYIY